MGLLQEGSAGINAKLCDQSTPQISTPYPKACPICTPSMDAPKLWSKKQLATPLDTSLPIPEERKRRIQQIIGTLIYYALTVDCTVIPPLNALAEKQPSPTKNAEAAITHFLDYAATNPSAII